MKSFRTATLSVAAAALCLAPLAASANSDFEGEWVLNVEKSRGLDGISAATQAITLEGKNVRVARHVEPAGNEPFDIEYVYLTHGNVHTVGPENFSRDVTAEWKGNRLVVKWTIDYQGIEVKAEETWKKKRAGLEMKRVFTHPAGESVQKFIFVRP